MLDTFLRDPGGVGAKFARNTKERAGPGVVTPGPARSFVFLARYVLLEKMSVRFFKGAVMTTYKNQDTHDFVIAYASSLDAFDAVAFEHSVALASESNAQLFTIHTHPGKLDAFIPEATLLLSQWDRPNLIHNKLRIDNCDAPVSELIQQLRRIEPDLLIVGKRQGALSGDAIETSVSEALSRNLRNPTLVLPHGQRGFVNTMNGKVRLRRVLIPVEHEDAFHPAMEAFQRILNRISANKPELILVHAGDTPPACFEDAKVTTVTREGTLEQVVLEVAQEQNVDLIAMSTHGHDSLSDMRRGSRTERVLRSSQRPVLVVPFD